MIATFPRVASACMGALICAVCVSACSRPDSASEAASSLRIKGSDTMVHLVSAWSEAYMNAHPETSLSLTGGGSGTGIAALLNGTTDICMSSRNIKEEEQQAAEEKGLSLEETVVGRDGIAIAVHSGNPVDSLTMEQLEKIFTGAYQSWSEVGGPEQPITILSRESSSGTYVFFQEHVLNKKDFTTEARLLPANPSIVQALQSDQWSIGYIGLGYAEEAGDSVKVLPISGDADTPAVAPSRETVSNSTYPIARTLLFYTPVEKSPLSTDFITFCLSPEGQSIVAESGYVPLN